MRKMFRFPVAMLFLSLGLLAGSCSKDDDSDGGVDPTPMGNTQYDGHSFAMKNGYYLDGGGIGLYGDNLTHHLDYFILTDGTATITAAGTIADLNDGKIAILTPMLSAGASSLKAGTFQFTDLAADLEEGEEKMQEKFEGKSFFFEPVVVIDTDGDGDWEEETSIDVTGGSMTISGNLPNLTVEYTLTTAAGKEMKGKYSGKFTQVQGDDEGEGLQPKTAVAQLKVRVAL